LKIYDLIIIGAGPAGIYTSISINKNDLSVLLLERGGGLYKRKNLAYGWFGTGLYSLKSLELEDSLLKNRKEFQEVKKKY
jgi:flavin-dependent dehydrogenase